MTNRWLVRFLLLWACLALPLESVALTVPASTPADAVTLHDVAHAMPCCDDGDCLDCADAGMPTGTCAKPCAITVPAAIACARQPLEQAACASTAWPPLATRLSPAHSLRPDRPPAT